MTERDFWDKATESTDLRNEWICDENVTDEQCLEAIGEMPGVSLDLGCGIGRLTRDYGIDVSSKMLDLAKPGPKYRTCNGRYIPYADGFFDSVYSTFMFQHIPNPAKYRYVKEVFRVLKDGGIFRLQYVEGDNDEPFSHDVRYLVIESELFKTGFRTTKFDFGLIYPQWTWVTAQK